MVARQHSEMQGSTLYLLVDDLSVCVCVCVCVCETRRH